MAIKAWFIKKTNREGLVYQLADLSLYLTKRSYFWARHGHLARQREIKKYLNEHKQRKLHLGCGEIKLDGFLNSDIFGRVPIDITKKLPFPDATIDLIYSYHLVEHIYRRQFINFLREAYRVLKPKGIMLVGMPSLAKVARALYAQNDGRDKQVMLQHHLKYARNSQVTAACYLNDLMHICFGHKYLYDLDLIKLLGRQSGFDGIKLIMPEQVPDAAARSSLPTQGSFRDRQTEIYLFEK